MYTVKPTAKFQKDLKCTQRRGYDTNLLTEVIERLAAEETLDAQHNDHPLKGNYIGCRECHITPDWLLIYQIRRKTPAFKHGDIRRGLDLNYIKFRHVPSGQSRRNEHYFRACGFW